MSLSCCKQEAGNHLRHPRWGQPLAISSLFFLLRYKEAEERIADLFFHFSRVGGLILDFPRIWEPGEPAF